MTATNLTLDGFNFRPGQHINQKYRIMAELGSGWEGEVYRLKEIETGIITAGKFFYPNRNRNNETARQNAKLLNKLANCPIITNYHGIEYLTVEGQKISCLLTEHVNGSMLDDFLYRQPGGRIGVFRGLQLLHALAVGLESMHTLRIYHGDLHTSNIMVKRYGLGFDLKILDLHRLEGTQNREGIDDDICDAIKVFYDAVGGQRYYAKLPKEAKDICCGLKRSLILKKFKNISTLRKHLENIEWQSSYRE